jgi:hypothetical protein
MNKPADSAALTSLARAVGLPAAELAACKALDAAQLRDLTALVEAARERDAREMDAAIQESLKHIPALLRGPVLKILGGGK